MKSLNIKLALSAIAIAMLATPALAARAHERVEQPTYDTMQSQQVGSYPNGAVKTGSAESVNSGADFNLLKSNRTD